MQTFEDIVIDPEFAARIPPLALEERKQLETNIIEHGGARDPLVMWNRKGKLVVLDGHNRYEICTRLGLPFDIHELSFTARDKAADWIARNQLGRRNLTPDQMTLLRGRRYNRAKMSHGGEREASGQNVHLKTAESLAAEHGVNEKTIRRDGEFAAAVETLGIEREIVAGELDVPRHDIVAAAKALPADATPEQVEAAREAVKSRPPHVGKNTGNPEWYTPKEYIEAARAVMGGIDLDPASTHVANDVVKAATYYSKEVDGLSQRWSGRVWMNPPYQNKIIGRFVKKLVAAVEAGDVIEAVVLVNNATETKWFNRLVVVATGICFPRRRIRFWHPDTSKAAPLQGQAVVYIGRDLDGFAKAFETFGWCVDARKPNAQARDGSDERRAGSQGR